MKKSRRKSAAQIRPKEEQLFVFLFVAIAFSSLLTLMRFDFESFALLARRHLSS